MSRFLIITITIFSLHSVNLYSQDNRSENSKSNPESKLLDKIIKKNLLDNKVSSSKEEISSVDIFSGYIGKKSESNEFIKDNLEIKISEKQKLSDYAEDLYNASEAYRLGQIEIALHIYKKVLSKLPNNYDALFGIASIYQINKQLDEARTLYTKILTKFPNDEPSLNNFIKLSSEDAPDETILGLIKLESIRPESSSIPAQIAIIYDKINNPDLSIKYLHKAIELSPGNMIYRYNLAVIYDKNSLYKQSLFLYRQVLKEKFTNIVQDIDYDQISKRIDYLSNK